ncbi:ferredoxin reductase [Acinetobacter sp. WZC-1]|uniref:ferredoxin reductase n=1 Tax=Acinetobacter sp. WZC-1 TaxID=3459034 RepID=UPI00403DA04B
MQVLEKIKRPVDRLIDGIYDQTTVDFWLQQVNPLWSVGQALGKIVKKEHTAADVVSLTIQCNRNFQQGQAGQHHPVIVEYQGRRYERTYSLTQVDSRHVLLTVKKVSQGIVSSWLVEQARPGDMIGFGSPYGDMQIPDENAPMILLAAGSGITPMYSLIQQLIQTGEMSRRQLQLLYWSKTREDAAFRHCFEQLAAQYSSFKFQAFYTRELNADARLNETHIADISHLPAAIVYACGPGGFVASAETLCAQAGQLKTEAFSLNPVISAETGFVNITLTQSGRTVAIPVGQSILAGLEQQNIKPQHGCRMGVCNKCACNKRQGATRNLINGSENTEPGNLLKLCVNSAQSDLMIDL